MQVTVYRKRTIIESADIDAPTEEQALKFARASEGMENAPIFGTPEGSVGPDIHHSQYSLSPDIGKRKPKADVSK